MPFDYSQAAEPRDFSELIPHNTIATTQMRIRPGNAGPDGLYKRTAKGDAEGLDCEFMVLDGPFAGAGSGTTSYWRARPTVRRRWCSPIAGA